MSVLHVGALPDRSPDGVREQHQAVIREVCRIARVSCVWVDVSSYEGLVDALGRGGVDFAYFGGATFAQAHHRFGAVPLVMRDVDFTFTSAIIVRSADSARRLQDLKGRSFAFGDPNSTSGNYMPRYFLRGEGVDPERFFRRVVSSPSHDSTMRLVASGQVSAGVVNAPLFYGRQAAADRVALGLRPVWRSPPYTDYVWAARRELPAELRQRLIDGFLDLDVTVAEQRAALEREGAAGYVPAYVEEFDQVTAVLRQLGKL